MGSEKSSEHRSSSCFYFVLILDLALGVAGEYLEMADGGAWRCTGPRAREPRNRDQNRRASAMREGEHIRGAPRTIGP